MKLYSTKLFAALFLLCASTSVVASPINNDLLKAQYLYNHLAFNEAIVFYEKVATTSTDPEIFAQLGDCYRLIKQPKQAVVYYAKAVALKNTKPVVKLHYAQSLMAIGQYSEATSWLKSYQKDFPKERRVANLITGAEQASEILKSIPEGGTSFLNLNTNGNEFGPVIKHNELLFTADTVVSGRVKTDHWTGNPYYNMYAVKQDSNGTVGVEYEKIGNNLNTKFHDGPISFTADGKISYFTRTNIVRRLLIDNVHKDNANVVHLEIMEATGYNSETKKFNKVKPFQYNSKEYSTAHPSVSPSGNTIVFSSDMPGTEGGTDLYITRKSEDGKWSMPLNLGKSINTEGDELFPYLFNDSTLYFASDGWPGLGGLDIFESVWNPKDQVFSIPKHMGVPINSSFDDMSITLNEDGNSGYFASNRIAPKNGDNIYYFKNQKIHLSLTVVDEYSDAPITGCTVAFQSVSDTRTLTTGKKGLVLTRVYPQTNYTAEISRLGYKPQKTSFSTVSTLSNDTINVFVKLTPNTQVNYNALVLDKETLEPIDNPLIVVNKIGGQNAPDSILIPTGEDFNHSLKTNEDYQIYALKPNYYSDEKFISTKGIIPGSNDNIRDTIFMKRLAVGVVIKIENIYYDYDKANIRQDAKPSLNRLYDLLVQNSGISIQINSHTDCRGADSYNLKLSDARAASVVKFLIEKGIDPSRMQSKGFGESNPIANCVNCNNCSEQQHQENRRTEFQILKL